MFKRLKNTPVPLTRGSVVYHAYNEYGDGSSTIFIYNFEKMVNIKLELPNSITDPMNAQFSPDGKLLVLMARDVETYWQIYTLSLETNQITQITNNHNRNEDPKWISNNSVVYKSGGSIYTRDLRNSVENLIHINIDGEKSMPHMSPNNKYLSFALGVRENSKVYIQKLTDCLDVDGSPKLVSGSPGVSNYYPIFRDTSLMFFTKWASATNKNDQLYVYSAMSRSLSRLRINDFLANNSDACPVDEDFIIFSSTSLTPHYSLFLGNINTGHVWRLVDLYKNVLGAHYSKLA